MTATRLTYAPDLALRRTSRTLLLGGAAALVLWGAPALAQTSPGTPAGATAQSVNGDQTGGASATPPAHPSASDPTQTPNDATEIIVTGSRLSQGPVTVQPAEVLGAEQIQRLGYTNLGRALQELPAFSVPANSPIGSQGSFGAGQTFVNLYNLGAQRTLSLVDGQRVVTTNTSSIFGNVAGDPVDFSLIPTQLVERVDVVSVVGAPIYGSDAIAGTVNVILKKNFEGLEFSGQAGLATQYHDGARYEISGLAGKNFADGRGNVTLSVEYDRQRGIPTSDRPSQDGSAPFFGDAADSSSSYSNQLYYGGERYNVFTNTGMPLTDDYLPVYSGQALSSITNAAGQPLYFNASGKLTPFNNGQLTGSGLYQAGGDGFRIGDYDNFLADSHRVQATLLGHYDFSDHIKANFEGWYGRNTATNLRAQPFYNTWLFANAGETNGNLILSTDNPYLSAGDRQTIISSLAAAGDPTDTFYLARANTDLATGAFKSTSELYRFVGGLTGDFGIGSHQFTWEVTGNYGHSKVGTTTREVVTQNYYNALDAVTDASGNIVCRPGYTSATIATVSSTCAPLDVFGVGQASQAALDYISAVAKPKQTNSQLDVIADVKGSLLTLPGGDVKGVLGYEHRREHMSFDPGAFYLGELQDDGSYVQYGNSIPITPVSGSFHTNEEFAELDIPIVSPDLHIPLIHSLDAQGAARHVNNSINGGIWTYTYGGKYAPIQDITFRGNYTRSLRSPSITEAFAPIAPVYNTADDPCDPRYITGGPDPSRRAANCAAAGVPTTMIDPGTGKVVPFKSNIVDYTVLGTAGGNPNLQNETAKSWTAGGVLTPRFLKGFQVSADYVSIDIKNEIASLGPQDLLDACYDSTNFPSDPFCSTFTRDSSGQITSFASGNYNIGVESFRALQLAASLQFKLSRFGLPTSWGGFDISGNWLHTFRHFYKVGEGDKQYTVGTTTEPKDNFTINANYVNGAFDLLWQTTYYGPTQIDVNDPITTYQYPTVGAFWQHNVSVGYTIDEKYTIRAIVENVLNKHVPFPYDVSRTRYYDEIMGRYATISVDVKF